MQTRSRPDGGGFHFLLFSKIVHEVERAMHNLGAWRGQQTTCTKETDPARGVDRAVLSPHAEWPLTPLDLRHYPNLR